MGFTSMGYTYISNLSVLIVLLKEIHENESLHKIMYIVNKRVSDYNTML